MKELLCSKCGSSISIGMMVCPVCGAKPDAALVEKNARAKPSRNWPFRVRGGVAASLLFIFVAIIGLVVWPHANVIGLKGNKNNARSLINRLQAFNEIDEGSSLGVTLNEVDINAYLKFVKVPKSGIAFCSMELTAGLIHVRAGRKIGPYKFFKYEFSPRISVDTWYKVENDGFIVSKASVGHLPIFGSLKCKVADKVKAVVWGDSKKPDWLDSITSVEVKKEQLVITVKKASSAHGGSPVDESGSK